MYTRLRSPRLFFCLVVDKNGFSEMTGMWSLHATWILTQKLITCSFILSSQGTTLTGYYMIMIFFCTLVNTSVFMFCLEVHPWSSMLLHIVFLFLKKHDQNTSFISFFKTISLNLTIPLACICSINVTTGDQIFECHLHLGTWAQDTDLGKSQTLPHKQTSVVVHIFGNLHLTWIMKSHIMENIHVCMYVWNSNDKKLHGIGRLWVNSVQGKQMKQYLFF